jgi:hypothetical protein
MGRGQIARGFAVLLVAATALAGPRDAAAQNCGGTERWAVKVGADAGAAQVNLTPVPATIHDLVQITRPSPLGANAARTAAERAVRVVDGRLIKFKQETGKTGDMDFHLVVSDETLLHSGGGQGSTISPHGLIAEIVDPTCIAGRGGTGPTPSLFATQLTNVRNKFLAQYPTWSAHDWTETGGIPVRLTGVVFFDRDHKQWGRASNGLELHPLLDIEFNPSPPPVVNPPTVTVTNVPLTNPGFESQSQGWTATTDVITSSNNQAAHGGQWKAWLGGYGETHTDKVSQDVTLPASATAISLTFFLHVDTEESENVAYDKLRVRVRRTNGTLLATLKTFSNLDKSSGFTLRSVDLSAYRGQTVRIALESQEDSALQTSFVVDDFGIVVEGP